MKIPKLHKVGMGGRLIIGINLFLMALVFGIIGINYFF
jgi:hypothetical protein